MQDWHSVGQGVHDNITLILVILVVAGFIAAWLVFQTFRSAEDRGEISRLRRRLRDMEVERAHAYSDPGRSPGATLADPLALTPRWVRKGAAATTADGGCLLIVHDTVPPTRTALLTIRVDGLPVYTHRGVRAGHSLQVRGNLGTYTVEVSAVEPLQAMVAISLRNRHAQAASSK